MIACWKPDNVLTAPRPFAVLRCLRQRCWDAVVQDRMLPDLNSLSVKDGITRLARGADNYLAKSSDIGRPGQPDRRD